MTKARITAILPCYNHSHYLPERIKSVLAQTRPVDEIIFLDDASTDDSVLLARRLLDNAHCPVVIEPNLVNSGSTFVQWNKGVNLASGDLIWIAETDDSCDNSLLETLLDSLQRNSATLAWTQSAVIDAAGKRLHSAGEWHEHLFPGLFDHDFVMQGDLFVRNYLSCINLIPNASAALFSRAKYIRVGPANELMRYAGDWLQWIKLIQGGRVCFVNQELNYFRCHFDTTRSSPSFRDLYSENIVCMSTALASTIQAPPIADRTTGKILIKQGVILSKFKNKVFIRNMLKSISFNDIPRINSRVRDKGGLVYFSLGAITLLGWLVLIRYFKDQPRFALSRLFKW